jgi:hypothetical protein
MRPKLKLNLNDVQVESFDVGGVRGAGTVKGQDMFEMDPFAAGAGGAVPVTPGGGSCNGTCETCKGHITCTCPASCVESCYGTCDGGSTCPPCYDPITSPPGCAA